MIAISLPNAQVVDLDPETRLSQVSAQITSLGPLFLADQYLCQDLQEGSRQVKIVSNIASNVDLVLEGSRTRNTSDIRGKGQSSEGQIGSNILYNIQLHGSNGRHILTDPTKPPKPAFFSPSFRGLSNPAKPLSTTRYRRRSPDDGEIRRHCSAGQERPNT